MGKLVTRLLLFAIVFLLVARILGNWDNIDKQQSTNPNIIRIANAHLFDSLDILFVGNSAAYSGINPFFFDSIGLRTYNLSIAAAGPVFYKLLCDDYLRSAKQKPHSVYLLLMPATFMEQADDLTEIGIHRYLDHPVSNEKIVKEYSQWNIYPSLLIKSFKKGVRNIVYREKASKDAIAQTVNGKGFYRSDETTSTEIEKKEMLSNAGFKKQTFDPARIDFLEKYADSLQRQGIKVVFFSVPGNKMNSFYNKNFIEAYHTAVTYIQEKYGFLHAEDLLPDSSCFRNSDHLNTKGAAIVSRKIIDGIKADSSLRKLYTNSFGN